MTDYFAYNDGKDIIPTGAFRISPSQASRFFSETHLWYREMLLDEAKSFTGSTSTELGTCVHVCAQMFVETGTIDHNAINQYISTLGPDFDKAYIREQYPPMADALITSYLQYHRPSVTEKFLWKETLPGIGVAGSLDSIYFPKGTTRAISTPGISLDSGIIVDYKTTSSRTQVTRMPRSYYIQQMMYWWLAKQHGYDISTIRLVYITTQEVNRISDKTGKPLKDYFSECYTLDHVITSDDKNIIENVIDLISESVDTWNKKPELRYLLAQDYRLKTMFAPTAKIFGK
jgi:hypothetical protein